MQRHTKTQTHTLKITKVIIKNGTVEGVTIPNFNLYSNIIVINREWYCYGLQNYAVRTQQVLKKSIIREVYLMEIDLI